MPLPPGMSQKDGNQVLRAVMDDDTNRLRVDAIISPDGHDLEIHYTDDSIAIGDPASDNILAINSDGSLNVNATIVSSSVGNSLNTYNEVTGIAMGSSSTVVTYTVPVGKTLHLTRIEFSSDSVSTFEVDLNGVTNAKKRLHYTSFNNVFEFFNDQDGLALVAGTVINVVATNNSVNGPATFNSNIQGVLS